MCDKQEALFIRFVMNTGARIGEALRLKPEDIHQDFIVLYAGKIRPEAGAWENSF